MTRNLEGYVDPCSGRASHPPDPDAAHPVTRGPTHAMPSIPLAQPPGGYWSQRSGCRPMRK
jgi:hypothetical protein